MKSILNFEHLERNMNLRAYILTKIRTPKYVVKLPLRKTLQQATWKTVQNTVEICTTAPLSDLLINVKEIGLEEVSLTDMQNVRSVSLH